MVWPRPPIVPIEDPLDKNSKSIFAGLGNAIVEVLLFMNTVILAFGAIMAVVVLVCLLRIGPSKMIPIY